MYKHENKGNGIITVTDDSGKHQTFLPGTIITLNRIYKEIEKYGIVCTNPEEKRIKSIKKIDDKIKETIKESDE